MSLQVNLSSKEISDAYHNVVAGRGIDWAIFTYDKGTNDLKVQSTGDGGLEELQEEFSDGKIQYAFARVTDPNSKLPKFVQINWCGDGVPVAKKGLFHSHSSAVSKFLRGTHVVISARNESDVAPSLIMQHVEAASGARYSAHNEKPRKFEPIAPVGTNYSPIGRPDIAAMRRVHPAPSGGAPVSSRPSAVASAVKPPVPSAPRPVFGAIVPAPVKTAPPRNVPDDDWADESPPPPAAARPPAVPTAPRPAPTSSYIPAARAVPSPPALVVSSNVPIKPSEEDRITPVGTAYTPIKLTPGKLKNPFQQFEAQVQQAQSPPRPGAGTATGGAKKLTWSERQALSRKQAEEEKQRSKAASWESPTSTGANVAAPGRFIGQVGGAAVGGAVIGGAAAAAAAAAATTTTTLASQAPEPEPEFEPEMAPPPPPPPALPLTSRPRGVPQAPYILEPKPEPEPEEEAPPPPPPPPPPLPPVLGHVEEQEEVPPPPPPPAPPPPVVPLAALSIEQESGPNPEPVPTPAAPAQVQGNKGICAVVLYDYEATEDNEMNLVEGEVIEQIEEVDEGWWSGVGKGGAKTGLFPANYVELIEAPGASEVAEEEAPPPPPPPPPPAPAAHVVPPAPPAPPPPAVEEGIVAVALYDYDVAEDNEVTFREGERITEIEDIADGWWQGKNSRGEVGMFPANYVELIEP